MNEVMRSHVVKQETKIGGRDIRIFIERKGRQRVSEEYARVIKDRLHPYRMIGDRLRIAGPSYVAVRIRAKVIAKRRCANEVRHALGTTFGDQAGGFFSPERFGFGDGLTRSSVAAQAAQLPHVVSFTLVLFKRDEASGDEDLDEIEIDGHEIIRLALIDFDIEELPNR